MKTKNYIEFRVYLLDTADPQQALEAAEELQDELIDFLTVDKHLFTQDVSYELHIPLKESK